MELVASLKLHLALAVPSIFALRKQPGRTIYPEYTRDSSYLTTTLYRLQSDSAPRRGNFCINYPKYTWIHLILRARYPDYSRASHHEDQSYKFFCEFLEQLTFCVTASTCNMIYLWCTKKRHLTILNQRSYGLYPAGNVMFRVSHCKAKIIQ